MTRRVGLSRWPRDSGRRVSEPDYGTLDALLIVAPDVPVDREAIPKVHGPEVHVVVQILLVQNVEGKSGAVVWGDADCVSLGCRNPEFEVSIGIGPRGPTRDRSGTLDSHRRRHRNPSLTGYFRVERIHRVA